MRVVLAVLLLVLGGAVVPTSEAAAEPFLKDAEGDTQLHAVSAGAPTAVPFTAADAATVDLLAFDVLETDTALELVFQLKTLKRTAGFASYEAYFTWNDVDYVASTSLRHLPPLGQGSFSMLYVRDDFWDARAELEHEVDVEAGTLKVRVEKAYVLDGDEDVPDRGDVLKDVHAETRMNLAFLRWGVTGEVRDRAPDGEEAKPFTLQLGDVHTGHLRAEPETRVRVSNGGSTTFVYRVEVANAREADDELDVSTGPLPEGWNVTLQSPIRIDGDDKKTVTVLASVPFGHTHGGFDSFNVTFQSRTDPGSRATVRLGVLHTPIPQPAGHHNELFLHVAKAQGVRIGDSEATMNTDPDHANDEPEALAYRSTGEGVVWWIPLNPRLAMGLDFDVERTGTLVGSVIGRATGEGEVRAELLYGMRDQWGRGDEDVLTLAESDAAPVTLDLQKPASFTLTLTPTEDADYVEFHPDMTLYLKVVLDGEAARNICCLDGASPALVTQDLKLTLPLNEYHDKLTGAAEAVAGLDILAEGPVEKLARPGTTMTYAFLVRNEGSSEVVVDLDLAGGEAALGTLVPRGPLTLAPKESAKVTLAVAVPPEAKEGQELEVLVFAHAQDDPSRSAIARTKTTVALGSEAAPDETGVLLAAQEAENDTPGPGPFALLAALGAAALAARRRK